MTIHFVYSPDGVLGGHLTTAADDAAKLVGCLFWFDPEHGYNGNEQLLAHYLGDAHLRGQAGTRWRVTPPPGLFVDPPPEEFWFVPETDINTRNKLLVFEDSSFASPVEHIEFAYQDRSSSCC